MKVCKICLAMDVKLNSIKKYKLEATFKQLLGSDISTDNRLPKDLCVICYKRLINYSNLRKTSIKSQNLLLDVLNTQDCITEDSIRSLDKIRNNFTCNLSIRHYNVNHSDLEINESDCKIEEKKSLFELENVEVKNDGSVQVFFDEYPSFKEDNLSDVFDNNFHISEASMSSCDIPINALKEAKTKTEKKKQIKKRKEKKVSTKKTIKKKEITEPKIDRRRKPFLNEDLNETLFTITDLSYDEQIGEIQKRQESANFKNSVFKCMECFKGFLDEEAYNSHMVRHTDQCGDHSCDICKTHFKNPHALRKHITAHHTQRFNCNMCDYVTTHRQTARLHERWHKGTKYKCPHCSDEFVKFTTYMGHIRIKHPSDFVCALCGYSFVSAKGIELHKKLKHRLDDKPIPADGPFCETCNVRFVSSEALRKHMQVSARHAAPSDKEPKQANASRRKIKPRDQSESREDKDDKIEGDDKRYPSQIRKAEGPIPCEQCGIYLEDSRAYHGHFRRAHPDKNRTNYPSMKSPCMCEVCGRMFQSYALLKDHTWVHTGEKPFKCDLCSKSFRMKQRLVAHRRVHSNQRTSYECNVCGKQFSTHSNRQRHMFIHTGLKPFKCEMCNKFFKHMSEKRAHITYVHLKKPWPKRARSKRIKEYDRQGADDGESETAIQQPIWPECEPKCHELPVMADKNVYYHLKI